jgi:acetolactate synthase I/II/III large subunit
MEGEAVMPTGGQMVAEALRELGAETIFSVSGNQILAVYDAAGDAGLRIIHMRHESAAAYAAAGWAELRGTSGVVLVSAGPGFLASLTGVAVARSMELPLLLLAGAAATTRQGAGAFQDLDQRAAALAACKGSFDAPSIAEVGSVLAEAWDTALSGIPGPVHVSLPVDMLNGSSRAVMRLGRLIAPHEGIDTAALDRMAKRLAVARRPAIIARPSAARGEAGQLLGRLANTLGIEPLVTGSPRGLSDLKYAGLVGRLPDADCVLVIAPADFAVNFLADPPFASDADVLLVDAPGDPEPLRPAVDRVQAAPLTVLRHLAARVTSSANDDEWRRQPDALPTWERNGDGIHPLEVAEAIREQLQPEDTLVLDGGEFCQWVRWGLSDLPNRVIWNGKLGAIGGSIPLALGAVAAGGAGRVICVLGDGSAGYHLSEFETAVRYGLPFVTIVGNDARWAAEWHQQVNRFGPDRTFETELLPARYDTAAIGFGAAGDNVTTVDDLRHAIYLHLANGGPSCINAGIRSIQSPAFVE